MQTQSTPWGGTSNCFFSVDFNLWIMLKMNKKKLWLWLQIWAFAKSRPHNFDFDFDFEKSRKVMKVTKLKLNLAKVVTPIILNWTKAGQNTQQLLNRKKFQSTRNASRNTTEYNLKLAQELIDQVKFVWQFSDWSFFKPVLLCAAVKHQTTLYYYKTT